MKKMRDVSPQGMAIIALFCRDLSGRNLHPRTVQEYMADLKHFIGWHEYQGMDSCQNLLVFSFDQISTAELNTYLQAMQIVALKPSTINRRLSTIKLFFDWAEQHQLVPGNPAKSVKLVPISKKTPRMISEAGQKSLLEAVKVHGSLRDQAIIKLMLHTGLRGEAICSLQRHDLLDQGKARLLLSAENPPRLVSLNTPCVSIMERYLSASPGESAYLFPSEKNRRPLVGARPAPFDQKIYGYCRFPRAEHLFPAPADPINSSRQKERPVQTLITSSQPAAVHPVAGIFFSDHQHFVLIITMRKYPALRL